MYKPIVFACVLLASQVIAEVQPRDLIDEVQEQLEKLKSLVQGDILAAHDQLSNLETDYGIYSDNSINNGRLEIQEIHATASQQIATLKELANGAGKDVSACTDNSEALLNEMSVGLTTGLVDCTEATNTAAQRFLKDAQYFIDINVNKIYALEDQVRRCGNSIVCLEPIVTEIELEMVRLPANVLIEINSVTGQLSTLKLSVDQCSDGVISYFTSQSNVIVGDITTCVNRILDRP